MQWIVIPNLHLRHTFFQPRTPLEQEVAALLHGSEHTIPKTKELSKAEERALKAMSLEEVSWEGTVVFKI